MRQVITIRHVNDTEYDGDRVELESSQVKSSGVSVAGDVDEQARTRTQTKHSQARAHQDQAVPFSVSLWQWTVAVAVAGGGRRVGPDGGIGMRK